MKLNFKLSLSFPFIIYDGNDYDCDCGTYKNCPRKIKVGDNVDFCVENHFKCIKIQKFNSKLNKWYNKNYL